MLVAKDFISYEIPALKTSDSGLKALTWMDEFKVSHLPVVNNEELLGIISDDDIFSIDNPEEPIANSVNNNFKFYVTEGDHVYEVIKQVSLHKLSLIPVVDQSKKFIGVITIKDLLQKISGIASINDPGGILVLELNIHDYSLSQIAQIVESNNAIILSSYITSYSESTKIEVTLKINSGDLTRIVQTFNRYNYNIKATIHISEFVDDMRDRYDNLLNFINI